MLKMKSSKLADFSKLDEVNLIYAVPDCEQSELSPVLLDYLRMAQKMAGFQFIITSAFRSQVYERQKGRKGTSSHCKGLAVE